MLKLLPGLDSRRGGCARTLAGATVREVLEHARVPLPLVPQGSLNCEVLVNGRNISFLVGLDTPLRSDDRVTLFFHGARGFPGG